MTDDRTHGLASPKKTTREFDDEPAELGDSDEGADVYMPPDPKTDEVDDVESDKP